LWTKEDNMLFIGTLLAVILLMAIPWKKPEARDAGQS
jgi:hypothetical protein